MTLKLIADNATPDKPPKVRRAPKVAAYCPACGGSTWFSVNVGPSDVLEGPRPQKKRCCLNCLSQGKQTLW